jgi:hypothetical protein
MSRSTVPTELVSPEKALRVTATELVDLAPRLAQYVPHGTVTWSLRQPRYTSAKRVWA